MITAQIINRIHGGTVIAAWEVDRLDQAWLELFYGVAEMRTVQRERQIIENEFAKFRAEHKMRSERRH